MKRKNQTFFIHTSPSDTFEYIKSEVVSAYNSCSSGGDDDVTTTNMNLYIAPKTNNVVEKDGDKSMSEKQEPKGPIPDAAILSDHDVKNDDVLYVTFDEGEEIDIAK